MAVCNQAASANRFCIIGVPVNPTKQHLRALIGQMPKLWGLAGSVSGRVVENNKFQFIFTSEEAMNLTLRRGPWSFNEWMIVLQQWSPNFPVESLKIIPFWIQIRGIPLQFLTRSMIGFIGGKLGPVVEIDFDENSTRVDFVRVKVNWNVDNPLRFQRIYQFGDDVNTTLKFRYERLRNFCNRCGMLNHDKKDCPLNAEEDAVDPNAHDENHDDDDHGHGDINPAEDVNNAGLELEVMSPDLVIPGLNITGDEGYVPRHVEDSDLAVETVRYLQAKMAKGKFKESDFISVFAAYTRAEESPGSHKRKRRCFGSGMEMQDYGENYGMALSPIIGGGTGFEQGTGYESQSSCSGYYPMHGGAGGPVPPKFP